MSDIQLVQSNFINIAAQNINKAFVYISDCNLPLTIVNRNTDMVRKAGKLQRLSAEMLTYRFAFVTWYAKVHICVVSKE